MRYQNEDRGSGKRDSGDDIGRVRWHGDDGERRGRGRSRHVHPGGPFGGPGFPGGPGFRGGAGFRGGPFEGPDFDPGFGPGAKVWALREARGLRGPRARRGDVRAAALALLSEQPLNGYQIIQQIGERSGGLWRPSPGSVYPALQQLEDEGLIRAEAAEGGRRAYQLTEEGQQYVASHQAELRAPWDVVAGSAGGTAIEIRKLIRQVAVAAVQVVSAGTDTQAAQARQVLIDTRKALYRILAADDEQDETGSDD